MVKLRSVAAATGVQFPSVTQKYQTTLLHVGSFVFELRGIERKRGSGKRSVFPVAEILKPRGFRESVGRREIFPVGAHEK